MEPDTIRALFAALRDEHVEFVLIGALAMDVLGIGRFTEDIDLFVRPTPENIERLRSALRRVWQDPSIDEITAADLPETIPRCSTSLRTGRQSISCRDREKCLRSMISTPPCIHTETLRCKLPHRIPYIA